MSDPNRRQFLGAAAALPFVDVPSDGSEDVSSPAESDRGRFVDDDAPPRSELNRPSIDIEANHEVYQEHTEGQIGIRPIWAPDIKEVAQITLSLGTARVASGLGAEEVDQLIAELEHAKAIATEYSEGES